MDPVWAHESVTVEPPNHRWAQLAAIEVVRVRAALAPFSRGEVHHVGSTSVPELEAKPILDLMAGVPSVDVPAQDALQALGFCLVPPELDGQPWRRFYVLPKNDRRYAHLHLVVPETREWHLVLTFRDRLRADPALRSAYADLKRELAVRYRDDREAYTRAKASFILAALR